MKEKILQLVRFIYNNFTPLVIFYGVNHYFGLKPAILSSVLFTIVEIAQKHFSKKPVTGLFKYTAAMTLVFGLVDLYSKQSFLFKYEAGITNILTGLFFGYSLFAEKTIIQEFYEQRPDAKPIREEMKKFFRFITLIWVTYFFLKAILYFWMASHYSIEQGLILRTLVGSGSMYALIFITSVGGRKLFFLSKRLGLLGVSEQE